jgi:signal peptidase I
MGSSIRRWLLRARAAVLVILGGAGLVAVAWGDILVVRGPSMTDTLRDGDRVLVLRTDVLNRVPWLRECLLKKNRIVVFRAPGRSDELLIKRIVATGGETVRLQGADLIVNDRVAVGSSTTVPFDSSWPPPNEGHSIRNVIVSRDHYFVLSDNRAQQLDSRSFGAVRDSSIVAVVIGTLLHGS